LSSFPILRKLLGTLASFLSDSPIISEHGVAQKRNATRRLLILATGFRIKIAARLAYAVPGRHGRFAEHRGSLKETTQRLRPHKIRTGFSANAAQHLFSEARLETALKQVLNLGSYSSLIWIFELEVAKDVPSQYHCVVFKPRPPVGQRMRGDNFYLRTISLISRATEANFIPSE
jgi:hypothetical protein